MAPILDPVNFFGGFQPYKSLCTLHAININKKSVFLLQNHLENRTIIAPTSSQYLQVCRMDMPKANLTNIDKKLDLVTDTFA